MKILERYVLKEFLKLFVMSIFAFVTVFMLVEFVEKIDDLLERGVPALQSAAYFTYKLPGIFSLISPVAVLLSVLLALGLLSKHSEITAIKAGGISILRVVGPLFACGLVISGFVIFLNESVVPVTNKLVAGIEAHWLDKKAAGHFGRGGLWVKNRAGIYNVKKMDMENGLMEGVTLYELESDFTVAARVHAKSAEWDGTLWVAAEAVRAGFTSDGRTSALKVEAYTLPELNPPDEFSSTERNYENMGYYELRDYIYDLERQGYDATRYTVDLYGKLSFPLVNAIMVLVGIPFALRGGRRGGIADGIAISVAIAFSFWIVFALTRSLGHGGAIPPILAAAFPDVLFIAIGALMYSYVRQ